LSVFPLSYVWEYRGMGAARNTEKSAERADKNPLLLRRIEQFLSSASRLRIEPFAFRLPKDGELDSYFGGTRTFWNERVLPSQNNGKPPVASVVVADPDAKRGCRFILYSSAKDYFERLLKEQTAEDG
jgi:hypothetical protein